MGGGCCVCSVLRRHIYAKGGGGTALFDFLLLVCGGAKDEKGCHKHVVSGMLKQCSMLHVLSWGRHMYPVRSNTLLICRTDCWLHFFFFRIVHLWSETRPTESRHVWVSWLSSSSSYPHATTAILFPNLKCFLVCNSPFLPSYHTGMASTCIVEGIACVNEPLFGLSRSAFLFFYPVTQLYYIRSDGREL